MPSVARDTSAVLFVCGVLVHKSGNLQGLEVLSSLWKHQVLRASVTGVMLALVGFYLRRNPRHDELAAA